jgi:histidine ammonia-lyase
MSLPVIALDGETLSIAEVMEIAAGRATCRLSSPAVDRMQRSRALVDEWVSTDRVMYGITTGFGEFSNVSIGAADLEQLQRNLILSHACGCGAPMPKDVTRAMMVLRANALAKGYSGIRIETVDRLLAMLNADIIPLVPSQGSVGSSGDLVQLAHLVAAMMGEGECWTSDGSGSIASAMALAGAAMPPVLLAAKEGLALINGTQMMTAYAAATLHRARSLAALFDIAGAMSFEALLGTDRAYHPQLQGIRPHRGQQRSARNLLRIIAGSALRESHRYDHAVVQDAYSLRCMPQVHGASRDAIEHVASVVGIEINSATDNPLIFAETGELIEGGNFHGQPIALASDYLAIALSEFANIAERRIERMVNGKLSGLPRFLTSKGGLHSGLMIAQYTAASLVSENKAFAHPASVDSIPTSANQEDHNSMGSIAARKAWQVMRNAEQVAAIELMTAAQALEFHRPKAFGGGTEAAFTAIRAVIPRLDDDRFLHADIVRAIDLVREDTVVEAVERVVGTLE